MDQRLGKNQKLKSKKLIDKLFIEGQSVKAFPLKLVYTEIDQAQISDDQVAFSVPKKLFKNATHRNRIKRLMREIFRKNKYLLTKDLSAPHAFMLIYISREEASYQKLETCFTALSGKFRKKLEGHEEKNS
ncbi:MAG: ribonuclease P protein component [Christiangramia sp.]|nr:ribonuclease P protein component [Christiangramia sp.]|tara:strand:- start:140 stop:532 length:393 start_codon:yes stop_codon:yes gene_type:complete